jgi:hypothetical protein
MEGVAVNGAILQMVVPPTNRSSKQAAILAVS